MSSDFPRGFFFCLYTMMAILKTNRIQAMAKIAATNILVWSFTNGLVACLVTIAEVAQISTRKRKKIMKKLPNFGLLPQQSSQ